MTVVSNLRQMGFSLDLVQEHVVEARRGSQAAFRVKGVFFAKPEEYPIVLCIRWDNVDGSVRASIAVYSEFVGVLTGARKKYQAVCDDVAALAARLASA